VTILNPEEFGTVMMLNQEESGAVNYLNINLKLISNLILSGILNNEIESRGRWNRIIK